jgi:hypothetical protein
MPEINEDARPALPGPDLQLEAGLFGVDTTTIDGRAYALPYCKACNGRVTRPFRLADLAEVLAAVRLHQCPKRSTGAQS